MCRKCATAHLKAKLRQLFVGLLVLCFFSMMVVYLFSSEATSTPRCFEPTDTNVELMDPAYADDLYRSTFETRM